jgi:hypothetical protein
MNWKTPQTQSVWVSLPFVLRRQTAQLLGVRASSGRPGYTRGRATIEIAVFGVLCATDDSLPYGAFMLGGDADLNHERLYTTRRFRKR